MYTEYLQEKTPDGGVHYIKVSTKGEMAMRDKVVERMKMGWKKATKEEYESYIKTFKPPKTRHEPDHFGTTWILKKQPTLAEKTSKKFKK